MWVLHALALAHQCIENEIINAEERECFFGKYSVFEELAGIAASAASCPETDCTQPCQDFDSTLVNCATLGVLVNYREPCRGYYATKVFFPLLQTVCSGVEATLAGHAKGVCSMWPARTGTSSRRGRAHV